ncbi:MAG: aldehyde dehydrogenase family protein, partial [Acidimicrobiia bacterium]
PAGVGHRGFTIRVPKGVVGAITPFNFPLNLAAHKIGPAIAVGCGVILKPSREAPLAAAELVNLLYDAGLPEQWLSVVIGPAAEITDQLIADSRVRMLTFTGSSEVGWDLVSRAPRKDVSLELGNSTPLIVCADGDMTAAARSVASSGFGFAGQSCISVQRVIVEASAHEEFVSLLRGEATAKTLGDPLNADTHIGPMINRKARDRVAEWVEEAKDHGAVDVLESDLTSDHLGPVVLDRVDDQLRVWREEVFGPVVSTCTFSDFDEAIDIANGTEFGLQAGVFTRDLNRALDAAERLEFGGVTINETPTFRVDQMPYGGTKESGNTREGPHYTAREMTEERVVVIGG